MQKDFWSCNIHCEFVINVIGILQFSSVWTHHDTSYDNAFVLEQTISFVNLLRKIKYSDLKLNNLQKLWYNQCILCSSVCQYYNRSLYIVFSMYKSFFRIEGEKKKQIPIR